MKCPQCKGSKTLNVAISEKGKEDNTLEVPCPTCEGSGQVTKEEADSWNDAMNLWCSCGNPSKNTQYIPDNVSSVCNKHHWVCDDCGKIVQVG